MRIEETRRTISSTSTCRSDRCSVLQFDEFLNYPGWQQGEYRAFMEWVEQSGADYEHIGYVEGGNSEQVAVRITAIGGEAKPEAAAPD